jgi:concanavalin A-like lectin/glucanase superfamily protein
MLASACDGSSPPGRSTGPLPDQSEPASVTPPPQVTDRYDRQVLSFHPVLYLALGNASSGIEPDLSGNGNNGSYEPRGGRPDLTTLPNGDLATTFDGVNQYVQVLSSRSLSVTDTGCLTVEAWIKPAVLQFPHSQGSGYVYVLGKGTAGKQEYAMRMYSYSNSNSEVPPRPNRISAYLFNLAGGKGSGAYFQDVVNPGDWIMVAFVIDSRSSAAWPDGYISIYKNGIMRGRKISLSQFNVKPGASNAPLRIGTRDLDSFFDGAIGKVAIYDSILPAQDILATYQAMYSNLPANCSGGIALEPADAMPGAPSPASAPGPREGPGHAPRYRAVRAPWTGPVAGAG